MTHCRGPKKKKKEKKPGEVEDAPHSLVSGLEGSSHFWGFGQHEIPVRFLLAKSLGWEKRLKRISNVISRGQGGMLSELLMEKSKSGEFLFL